MLNFANLSNSQKRFVVAVIESNPQYKTDSNITLKECAAIYYSLRDQRTGAKGEKIGYPNWLFNQNKLSRGVYQLPVPTDAELSAFKSDVAMPKVAKAKVAKAAAGKKRLEKLIKSSQPVEDSDIQEFNQILKENGIEV